MYFCICFIICFVVFGVLVFCMVVFVGFLVLGFVVVGGLWVGFGGVFGWLGVFGVGSVSLCVLGIL